MSATLLCLALALAAGLPRGEEHQAPSFAAGAARAGVHEQAQDEPRGTRPSEEELFGGEAAGDEAVLGAEAAREEALFGGAAAREEEIFGGESVLAEPGAYAPSRLLAEAAKAFEIGGLLFLRLDAQVFDEEDWWDAVLTSRNLLDLYADARPNDRVRAFASVRIEFDPTIAEGSADLFGRPQEPVRLLLDQLWLKGDIARLAFVTIGRQRIKWGASRFFNPTDFLNQQVRDPLDVFDRRLGVDLAKLHVPIEDLGWNFYFLTRLDEATRPWQVTGAARAELAFEAAEVTASTAFEAGGPFRLGADLSAGIWLFDVRLEGAALKGVRTPVFEGALDPEAFVFPQARSRRDEWILQGVVGADVQLPYSDQDTVVLGGEYFYNDGGYDDPDLYPWLIFQGAFTPLYVGRHYAAAYALLPAPGAWNDTSFTGSVLGNLSDGSALARLDVSTLWLTFVTLNAYGAWHFGTEGGELRFGLRVPPLPFVPGLEEGFLVPTPSLDVGVGARVAF